jgi:uncharacterized membrane protein YfcA
MFTKVKELFNRFENWVASWFPGFKTRVTLGLAGIGTAAALAQQYVTGLPTNQLIGADTLMYINLGLYTAAYWFNSLSKRHD